MLRLEKWHLVWCFEVARVTGNYVNVNRVRRILLLITAPFIPFIPLHETRFEHTHLLSMLGYIARAEFGNLSICPATISYLPQVHIGAVDSDYRAE